MTKKTEKKLSKRVTIIIPHLNQESALGQCLHSIADQTSGTGDLEVIVVDNGSTIMPEATVSTFAFARLLMEDEKGPGPARNLGVLNASGEYLFFIDADCMAHPDWVKSGLKNLAEHKVVGGDVQIAREHTERYTPLEAYESIFAYQQKKYIQKMGFSGSGNLAMHRAVFSDVGPFPGIGVAEDRAWGRMALGKGYPCHYARDMIIYHPARQSLSELYEKWERHVRHDYNEMPTGLTGKLTWIALSFAVLASIVVHFFKIMKSDRVTGLKNRCNAFLILSRVRAYRCRLMWRLLVDKRFLSQGVNWNR